MTDTAIENILIERFKKINELTGIPYLDGKNLALPNKKFTIPGNKKWFEISFLPDEPEASAMGQYAANRYTGIFQIDICVSSGNGDDEAKAKYDKICEKVFYRGLFLDGVLINKVYRAIMQNEDSFYRTVVRVEWSADLY